jgi:hypothetical protein
MGNKLNRQFSKEEIQMTNKYIKKHLISLSIKELQIKMILRFRITEIRIATIKKNKQEVPRWQLEGGSR